jgi:precorrin-2 dehydrogenase/sirohydrochlorin ferrochelatase
MLTDVMGDSSDNLRYLPVGLDVRGRLCVIAGGGDVGTRKALTLLRAGASVTVISPAVTGEIARQIEAGRLRWLEGDARIEHLRDAFLVIAATDDDSVNAEIVRAAVDQGSLVCDASSAERSQVIFGALLTREGVTVSVFTDGRDPSLARRTRDRIADLMSQSE